MFKLINSHNDARRGELSTVHGTIQTPVFMNVGTLAAMKGAVSTMDLYDLKAQVQLSNTYHLHLRPGDEVVKQLGGLHRFMNWDKPILTDSGGFQVFSLAKLRKIKEEGVYFSSHIDGQKIFMSPENSMQIQSNLASTIAMAFDECVENPSPYEYVRESSQRTTRWLIRCKNERDRQKALPDTINKNQLLFGINQGGTFDDLRKEHMKAITQIELDGYAIGGLAVGETTDEMYHIIETVMPFMPKEKPRYLMGVGTPANILEAVARGVDFFDCVLASRNARHAHLFTENGVMHLKNAKYVLDDKPLDENCKCPTCQHYSRAYIHHLFKAKEMLAKRLAVIHNLYFYNNLMEEIRNSIENNCFEEYKNEKTLIFGKRI